jgi:hypothetical protein
LLAQHVDAFPEKRGLSEAILRQAGNRPHRLIGRDFAS